MITYIIVLLAIAAILGLTVAVAIFKKKETPKPAVYGHGLVAALGLVLLIIELINTSNQTLTIATILIVAAALGGFFLFARDMQKKPGPVGVVVIHALLAVVGFLLILWYGFM